MMTHLPKSGAWSGVRTAVTAGDPALVADAVLALDEAGRREVARELPGHIGVARKASAERDRRRGVWTDGEEWIEPMRVAGAGALGGAAAVAAWLYRRDFTRWRPPLDSGPLLRVIAARPPEWQADLAVRLALRLRGSRAQARDDSVPLALELLRRTGAVPPDHDPLTTAWVSQPPDLEHDPLAEHLVPRLFEAEGVGRALREDNIDPPSWDPGRRTWLGALRASVAVGRFAPEPLVGGCLRRFLCGGSATDLRFFARLHEMLAPAPSTERTRDYLRLLPAAPGPVAELALRQLRGAGELSDRRRPLGRTARLCPRGRGGGGPQRVEQLRTHSPRPARAAARRTGAGRDADARLDKRNFLTGCSLSLAPGGVAQLGCGHEEPGS